MHFLEGLNLGTQVKITSSYSGMMNIRFYFYVDSINEDLFLKVNPKKFFLKGIIVGTRETKTKIIGYRLLISTSSESKLTEQFRIINISLLDLEDRCFDLETI